MAKPMKETHIQFRCSILGYVAVLTTLTGFAMFVVSLFLPATRGGDNGFFMMWLGVFGSFGVVPSDQRILQVYSLGGSLLNLTLLVAPTRWLFVRTQSRPMIRGGCGVLLVGGFCLLSLFPPPNSDGAIGYRVWVTSFLLVGVGLLLSTFEKPRRAGPACRIAYP